MRIATWNCKGAFHRKHDFAVALRPDILIVPEWQKLFGITQSLDSFPIRSFERFGDDPRKGLAVLSYGEYSLAVHPDYDPRHRWIIPLAINPSFVFDRPTRRYKFCDFFTLLSEHGLRSVYHHHFQTIHGDEADETFYLYHHADKAFFSRS